MPGIEPRPPTRQVGALPLSYIREGVPILPDGAGAAHAFSTQSLGRAVRTTGRNQSRRAPPPVARLSAGPCSDAPEPRPFQVGINPPQRLQLAPALPVNAAGRCPKASRE